MSDENYLKRIIQAEERSRDFIEMDKELAEKHKKTIETFFKNETRELKDEICKLERRLAAAEEVLEYYAKRSNWWIDEDYDGFIVNGIIDRGDVDAEDEIGYTAGGKQARAYLAKYAKKEEE